eukprot:10431_1
MSNPPLLSVRMAPLGGKCNWKNIHEFTERFNNKIYHFSIQTPRWFSIVEKSKYKQWRITMRKDNSIVGRVISEHDTEADAYAAKDNIEQLFEHGFVRSIQEEKELAQGDVISVPTRMWPGARHFGIYDKNRREVIEYQSVKDKNKSRIRATPFEVFQTRVRNSYDGEFDLKVHKYLTEITLNRDEVVERARDKIGGGKYGAVRKNCEAFALWAKTGYPQSLQSVGKTEKALDITFKVIGGITVLALIAALAFLLFMSGAGEAIAATIIAAFFSFLFVKILVITYGAAVGVLLFIGAVAMWLHRCIANGSKSFDQMIPSIQQAHFV